MKNSENLKDGYYLAKVKYGSGRLEAIEVLTIAGEKTVGRTGISIVYSIDDFEDYQLILLTNDEEVK